MLNTRAELSSAAPIYALSTGKPLGRRKPHERMSDSQHIRYLIDARLVRGTPLILLHWWRFQYPDPRGLSDSIIGGRFTLVDENADIVWDLDLPRDYSIPGDEDAQDRLMQYVQRHGAVLRNDQQSRFDLYFAAQAQRVTYDQTKPDRCEFAVSATE